MTTPKPGLSKIRISLAVGIAGMSDLLQIPIHAMSETSFLAMPGEAADLVLDIATGISLTLIVGFHPAFMPSFIAKTMRSMELMPTWTATVAYVVWKRKDSGEQPATAAAESPATPQPAPTQTHAPADMAVPAKASGLWILAIGAAVIGGMLWVRHKPSRVSQNYGGFQPAPMQRRSNFGRPVVAVGPVENHTPAHDSLSFNQADRFRSGPSAANRKAQATAPERICTTLEDILSRIDGIELVQHEQMRFLQNRLKDKTDGFTPGEKIAALRNIPPASIIVLAAIVDLHDEKTEFKGYNIEMQSIETKCSLRLDVIDTASGSILFTKTLNASKTQTQSAAVTATTADAEFEAIKAALGNLENDQEFKSAVRGVRAADLAEVQPKSK
jgi:hypothetical protein